MCIITNIMAGIKSQQGKIYGQIFELMAHLTSRFRKLRLFNCSTIDSSSCWSSFLFRGLQLSGLGKRNTIQVTGWNIGPDNGEQSQVVIWAMSCDTSEFYGGQYLYKLFCKFIIALVAEINLRLSRNYCNSCNVMWCSKWRDLSLLW